MKLISICLCNAKYLFFNDSTIFKQRSFIECIMIKPSMSLLSQFYSTQGFKTRQKNYYDILGITPHATLSEIKSAYYKLSLQYHPDKNKGEEAKQKFQDISDAYEVLGNHELRRNYDRHIIVQQKPMSSASRTTSQRKNVHSTNSKIYNFDDWVKAHYGKQFQDSLRRRRVYDNIKEMEKLEHNRTTGNIITDIVIFLFIVMLYVHFYFSSKNDVPVSKIKEDTKED